MNTASSDSARLAMTNQPSLPSQSAATSPTRQHCCQQSTHVFSIKTNVQSVPANNPLPLAKVQVVDAEYETLRMGQCKWHLGKSSSKKADRSNRRQDTALTKGAPAGVCLRLQCFKGVACCCLTITITLFHNFNAVHICHTDTTG